MALPSLRIITLCTRTSPSVSKCGNNVLLQGIGGDERISATVPERPREASRDSAGPGQVCLPIRQRSQTRCLETGSTRRAFSTHPKRSMSMVATYHATRADPMRKYVARIRLPSMPASSATASSADPHATSTKTVIISVRSRAAKVTDHVIAASTINRKGGGSSTRVASRNWPIGTAWVQTTFYLLAMIELYGARARRSRLGQLIETLATVRF